MNSSMTNEFEYLLVELKRTLEDKDKLDKKLSKMKELLIKLLREKDVKKVAHSGVAATLVSKFWIDPEIKRGIEDQIGQERKRLAEENAEEIYRLEREIFFKQSEIRRLTSSSLVNDLEGKLLDLKNSPEKKYQLRVKVDG